MVPYDERVAVTLDERERGEVRNAYFESSVQKGKKADFYICDNSAYIRK